MLTLGLPLASQKFMNPAFTCNFSSLYYSTEYGDDETFELHILYGRNKIQKFRLVTKGSYVCVML